ncbi:TonB-dependent hemoglobin/transferrin/lactoferrin family receptor [Pseudomonas sp. NPDC007930]|uniref:TonB-dependent receptor n=1 Tax=Pseudomonas sp. NPDC007930 TaxID=3364417 RepID=UPI0036E23CBF
MDTTPRLPRRTPLAAAVTLGLLALAWYPAHAAPATAAAATAHTVRVPFNIPAQPLGEAVLAYAEQAGVQVFFESTRLAGLRSMAVTGEHTPREALALLLGSNPVSYSFQNEHSVSLERLQAQGDALLLGPVDITGRTETAQDRVFETPRSVAHIGREQMDRHIVRNAADLLEETEGVYSAVSLRDPGLSVNIRGVQDYGRVNMNIDGMRQNYAQMGHQARNGTIYVDPELLGGLDIYKGSSAAQGGAGVSGGIATFHTLEVGDILEPGQEVGGRLRASHGIGAAANGMHFTGSSVFAVRNEVWDGVFGYSERHVGNYDAGSKGTGNLSDFIGGQYDGQYAAAGERWRRDEVQYAGSVQRSYLAKFGLNLPNDQRLQLTHANTRVGYADASWDPVNSNSTAATVYKLNGSNQLESKSTGLDYSYSPDNPLVEVKAKLYYVSTRNFQRNAATLTVDAATAHYRTDTYGVQLENTSRFALGKAGTLAYNYGGELYRDAFRPNNYGDLDGDTTKPYATGVNPDGERTMASLFNNLTWDYGGWLTMSAGLRYDHYRMSGTAGLTRTGAGAEGEYGLATRTYTYDVDESQGRFSPSASLGVKPGLEWLQLYASYGRGWRPPTVTEVFTSGRPHGGGTERVYPNPFLKPERSRDYEVGFNIVKDSLFVNGDRLRAKVAYFNTRIDDFAFLDLAIDTPGATVPAFGSKMAYVNNLETTRFRGIDYKLSYDTGRYYGDLTYTHMVGSNTFCANSAYLGGIVQSDSSQPSIRVQTGTRTLASGLVVPVYSTVRAYTANNEANSQVLCGSIFGNAAYMPADRGALTVGSRWFDQSLDLGLRVRYSEGDTADQSEQNNSTLSQRIWPRYRVFDAYASWWVTPNLNLGLLLENFTDQAYLVAMGDSGSLTNLTLARGRTLVGSMEYRF